MDRYLFSSVARGEIDGDENMNIDICLRNMRKIIAFLNRTQMPRGQTIKVKAIEICGGVTTAYKHGIGIVNSYGVVEWNYEARRR